MDKRGALAGIGIVLLGLLGILPAQQIRTIEMVTVSSLIVETVVVSPTNSVTLAVPVGYNRLILVIRARADAETRGMANLAMRINGDSDEHYSRLTTVVELGDVRTTGGVNAVRLHLFDIPAGLAPPDSWGTGEVRIDNCTRDGVKALGIRGQTPYGETVGDLIFFDGAGWWDGPGPISSLEIHITHPYDSLFVEGSVFSLYGVQ